MHLFLCNSSKPVALHNEEKPNLKRAFGEDRGDSLAAIGAFCLMPNHYHLLIKEIGEGGITSFMRKLGTAYTMYFNIKYDRVGHLFSGQFRSRHVANDRYFQRVIQYIHCNPAELYEPDWKVGKVRSINLLEKKLIQYPYSSLRSFSGGYAASPILSRECFDVVDVTPVSRMLREARAYYQYASNDKFER